MTLVNSGGTPIVKAPGTGVIEPVAVTDPIVKVKVPVYRDTVPDGTHYPAQRRQLAYNVGDEIPLSKWNANFPAPEIDSVTPASGSDDGGTVIMIYGRNYTAGATVAVDGNAATAVTVLTPEAIRATTPAGTAGAKNVTVTTTGGTATKTGGHTYVA